MSLRLRMGLNLPINEDIEWLRHSSPTMFDSLKSSKHKNKTEGIAYTSKEASLGAYTEWASSAIHALSTMQIYTQTKCHNQQKYNISN